MCWIEGTKGLLFAWLFLALHMAPGSIILNFLQLDRRLTSWIEKTLARLCAGLYLSNLVFTVLAICRVLNFYTLIAYVAMVIVMNLIVWRNNRSLRRGVKITTPVMTSPAAILSIICSLFLLPVLLQTFVPNTDWDGATYHIPRAKQLLEGTFFNHDFIMYYFSFPGGVSLTYAFFMGLGSSSAILPYNFLISCLVVITIYAIAKRYAGVEAAFWVAMIAFANPLLWQLAVDPRPDNHLTFYIALALFWFLMWLKTDDSNMLILLGMSLSLGLGCKYTSTAFIFFFLCAMIIAYLSHHPWRIPKGKGLKLCIVLVIILIPNSIWYAGNVMIQGDPLYPFLYGLQYRKESGASGFLKEDFKKGVENQIKEDADKSPFADDLKENTPKKTRWRILGSEMNLKRFTLVPHDYAKKPNHELNALLLLSVFLPFLATTVTMRMVYIVIAASLVLLATWVYRYILPLLPLWSGGAGLVITYAAIRRSEAFRNVWYIFWGFILFYVCLQNALSEYSLVKNKQVMNYLSGELGEQAWLEGVGYNGIRGVPYLTGVVNQAIEAGRISVDDHIFMVGEAKVMRLNCMYTTDPNEMPARWMNVLLGAKFDFEEVLDYFQLKGIDYLLINRGYFGWVSRNRTVNPYTFTIPLERLDEFLSTYGNKIYENRGMSLYQLW